MMTLANKFNNKRALKLTLAAVGALLFLTPSVLAAIAESNISAIHNRTTLGHVPDERPMLLAQTESICPPNSGGSEFVTAETRNFYIYICGGDLPNTYVGISKNRRTGGIILPLRSYNNDRFVAANGNVRYTLTRSELIVTQNGRVIVRETATWKW